MVRIVVCLLAATYFLEPSAVYAAPSTPCTPSPSTPAIAGLAERLAATEDEASWASIVDAAGALIDQEGLPPSDRACAAYVAGSAAFFLSANRKTARQHAARAVGFFASAEALAPQAMSSRQPASRRRTAWTRLGAVPGWLDDATRPITMVLPPTTTEGESVRLTPAEAASWTAVCPGCPAPTIEVPRVGDAPSVTVRAGWYRVELIGRCGTTAVGGRLTGGVIPLPPPARCTATIEPLDGADAVVATVTGADGEQLDAGEVPVEASPITVDAPGYLPAVVTLPPAGGPIGVALERCPVDLEVLTSPPDAKVEGAGPGPWGQRTVRARAAGHGPAESTVDVPRPERCDGARHTARLALPRPVSVVATDHEGTPVSIARLVIQGEPAEVVGLYRVPGRYGLQAMHPTLGVVTQTFEVPRCADTECGAVSVVLRFAEPADGGGSTGSTVAYVAGGVMMSLGGLAGLGAIGSHSRILAYENKADDGVGIDQLVEDRDRSALAADVFLISGAVSLLVGYLLSNSGDAE